MTGDTFSIGLEKNRANYVPLTPSFFLDRAAEVHPHRTSIVYGKWRSTWAGTFERCRRFASALSQRGVGRGDVVAVLAPNVPAAYEAHFAVPMVGAVLNMLNTRLDAATISFMLRHGGAKVLLADTEYAEVVARAVVGLDPKPIIVDITDEAVPADGASGHTTYEKFLAGGDPAFAAPPIPDEWDAISLNYTSGTTGDPKGVVYHHRGAHLNAVSNVLAWEMPRHSVYLWTLPMFHCNGWCFPWTMAALAGTSVCMRKVDPVLAWQLIHAENVTHLCGAPIVYAMLTGAAPAAGASPVRRIKGLVGGAPPSPSLFEACARIGIDLTHGYGATEVYGPGALCVEQEEWQGLSLPKHAEFLSRQGVGYPLMERMCILDPNTGLELPADGATVGEIAFRGNIVMKGYLKNPRATQAAFSGSWYKTGDLGVKFPDNYIKIVDRSKDIIISGGENISSVEIEEVLFEHPSVLAAAVVAEPDEKWGEVPCAFVETKPGVSVAATDLMQLLNARLARFKIPKRIIFTTLPKTSTGKIQKFVLREMAVKNSQAKAAGE